MTIELIDKHITLPKVSIERILWDQIKKSIRDKMINRTLIIDSQTGDAHFLWVEKKYKERKK